jgi:hypothetical protein
MISLRHSHLQLPDTVQHAAMSSLQLYQTSRYQTTPPSSFVDAPLTPPPTNKSYVQAHRVIALFATIQAGGQIRQEPWREFRLGPGEYDEIERQLRQDEPLWGYVKDKIRCVGTVHGRDGS